MGERFYVRKVERGGGGYYAVLDRETGEPLSDFLHLEDAQEDAKRRNRTLARASQAEMERAVLVKPRGKDVKIDGWSI